jgi:hypothetical protein
MAKKNTGKDNSGSNNSGIGNSGDHNSGSDNSGHYNSGSDNSGSYNSGSDNSGSGNSGNYNSGHYNSGSDNSGSDNSGDYNSGDRNSGIGNSGHYNSGDHNSGFFNTDEPTVRMFNKDTGKKRSNLVIPYLYLPICEWVHESKMTDEQKKADPQFHIKQGTLIKRTYKEAWAKAWSESSVELKQQFLDLPNFDPAIFLEITGIDVSVDKEETYSGKIVEIDGKKYKLQEV